MEDSPLGIEEKDLVTVLDRSPEFPDRYPALRAFVRRTPFYVAVLGVIGTGVYGCSLIFDSRGEQEEMSPSQVATSQPGSDVNTGNQSAAPTILETNNVFFGELCDGDDNIPTPEASMPVFDAADLTTQIGEITEGVIIDLKGCGLRNLGQDGAGVRTAIISLPSEDNPDRLGVLIDDNQ